MADKSYPEGVTAFDHAQHDMKMGRFPNQSSVETFLAERATLAAQEEIALLPSGRSERAGEDDLAALSARAFPGPWEYRDDGIIGADRQEAQEAPWYGGDIICDMPVVGCDSQKHWPANGLFIVALVNAYRSGKLKETDPT